MRLLLGLVLLGVAALANAATVSMTFSWTQPTTYMDGSALPGTDITGNTIYDNGAVIGKLSGNVTSSAPIPITFTTCANHSFTATVTTKNGLESPMSKAVTIFMCQPSAPTLLFLPGL